MGTLDRSIGANVRRKIKLVDVTGKNATQIEDFYNTGPGLEGWRIIQVIDINSSRFIVAEKEV